MEKDVILQLIEEAANNKKSLLNLSDKRLTSLPPEIKELKNLTALYIFNNSLTSLPPEIKELKNLTTLRISHNRLTSLPPEIEELKNLRSLDLSSNLLTSLPPEIEGLKNLTELDLSFNQLTSLPPEIKELKNLTTLHLSHNRLTSLLPEIRELKNLRWLDLSNNQLTLLPPEIKEFENLTTLILSYNQLTLLPPEIKGLKNLTTLILSYNQLTLLPPEIKELKNLTALDLSFNHLKSLPREIKELKSLRSLDLYKNKLESLPFEILDLDLEIITKFIYKLFGQKLEGINLDGNPLAIPPIEIVKEGRDAIEAYFKSLEGKKQPLNEVKVLLVGEGGAGKTSLVKRLRGEEFDEHEQSTHGINLCDWEVKDGTDTIKVHFWDFGGQEIMHATHQFFLTKRSLYILVLDGRKEEKPEYWLKHIESFGGNSPVLVVLNKIDQFPLFPYYLNPKSLMEKYQGIKGFYQVSCKNCEGFEAFKKNLEKELTHIEHRKYPFAKNWFNIKTQLENMHENFVSYDEYLEMCMKENITDKSAQDTLLDFLNDLGVILHFKEFGLKYTQVLEPKWVIGAVYKIINSKKLAENKGVLKLILLDEILKQEKDTDFYYPPDKYNYIIELMEKFELCYKIDTQTILLPNHLQENEPNFDFEKANSLKFHFEYDFLPKSVMSRFIVKRHEDIKNELQWKTGVVLEDDVFHSTAVIEADEDTKKISIYVNGEQKRDFFSTIRKTIREINASFEKLEIKELVPLPDNEEKAIEYEELIGHYLEGEEKYLIGRKRYSVRKLLDGIEKEEELKENIIIYNVDYIKGDKRVIEGNIMGDVFNNIQNAKIINKSVVENSFNKVKQEHNEEVAKALVAIAEFIEKSGDINAATLFDKFNEELNKPNVEKSTLKKIWDGIEKTLPSIAIISEVVAKLSPILL